MDTCEETLYVTLLMKRGDRKKNVMVKMMMTTTTMMIMMMTMTMTSTTTMMIPLHAGWSGLHCPSLHVRCRLPLSVNPASHLYVTNDPCLNPLCTPLCTSTDPLLMSSGRLQCAIVKKNSHHSL